MWLRLWSRNEQKCIAWQYRLPTEYTENIGGTACVSEMMWFVECPPSTASSMARHNALKQQQSMKETSGHWDYTFITLMIAFSIILRPSLWSSIDWLTQRTYSAANQHHAALVAVYWTSKQHRGLSSTSAGTCMIHREYSVYGNLKPAEAPVFWWSSQMMASNNMSQFDEWTDVFGYMMTKTCLTFNCFIPM